ncbi:U7 snRNA-associated Sm-like protein LSm11 [Drosophila tropicalis]|uniref:U7 snRNA-associated Sm-like protein LSm11 n=1 Tax=Drosophila tropicalis TaxID=46794 RepID=UPI0035AB753D
MSDEKDDPGHAEQAPEQSDHELDAGSEQFNPLRALYADNFKISDTKPKVLYQNLAAFETALKKFGVWKLNKTQKSTGAGAAAENKTSIGSGAASTSKKAAEEEVTQRRFQPHQMPVKATFNKRHHRNLYVQMSGAEGPLSLLNKSLATRVRVLVRKEQFVAGSIEGDLVAFDKQWNILLRNAIETWQRRKFKYGQQNIQCGPEEDCSDRLNELGIALPHVMSVKSLNRKNVELKRKLNQILIRGEQVVLVSLIPKEKK